MRLKLTLIFLSLFFIASEVSLASHGMGGEITWTCQPNGQFVFQMKFYRDCNGIPGPQTASLNVCNHPTVNNIPLTLVQQNDISPAGCLDCVSGGNGTVEEFIFESAPITLAGTPPPQGWIFDWGTCCRSGAITNLIGAGGQGFLLRAIMYPYNAQNTNPCYDSSPRFAEKPNTILCGGFPFEYNNIAFDPELDSLVYSWAPALDDNNCSATALGYVPGYSSVSPLPGPTQNINNVAAVLNPNTGIVSYTSFTPGYFATVVQVDAYKCGQLVASIFREINIVLLVGPNCQLQGSGLTNLPPIVTAPFPDSTGAFTQYNDTVCAGDTVTFFMSATDPDWDPAVGGLQTVTMIGSGPQFVDFTNWPGTGCMNPPCAFTVPPLPTSAPFGTGVNLEWVTSCSHLDFSQGCFSTGSDYTFLIRAQDNFCDAPAVNFNTITITVLAPPALDSTTIRCVDVLANGDVTLTWTNPRDPYGSWLNYQIETAPGPGGPWSPLDSILVQNQTMYTHVGANAQNNAVYYRMYVKSGCDSSLVSEYSNVASSMFLDVTNPGNFTANLSWNPVHNPLIPGASAYYYIWQELPANSGNWIFIDSTNTPSYIDTLDNVCSDTVNYRVEVLDSTGCFSGSSIDGDIWQNILIPDPPSIRCVVVEPFGQISIHWVQPTDTASSFDGYFIYRATNIGGPYTVIDSFFNYNTTIHTDLSVSAYSGTTYYYQVETRTSCLSQYSPPSNAVTAILLNVSNANPAIANLTWNAIQTPILPSSNPYYYIYKDYPGGVWQLIDSTTTLSYMDTLTDICIDSINYRIEISDASGCTSISTIDGATFQIINVPDPPDLRCATVEPNGAITLTWLPPGDTASSFDGYFVYADVNGSGTFTLIDSIFTYGTSSYTHSGSNVYTGGPYFYKLTTRTQCANAMSVDSRVVEPIILTVTNVAGSANLSWNPVSTPLPPGAGVYDIFEEFPAGSGSWVLVGSTSNTSFVHPVTTVNCDDSVNYRVEQSNSAPCNSISSIDGATFYDAVIPDAPDFRCVSVLPNGDVVLNWLAPANQGTRFDKYRIYSSSNGGATFTLIDSIANVNMLTYTHVGAGAQTNSIYYYLETISCDNKISLPSVTLQTILISVSFSFPSSAALSWNPISTPALPSSSGTYEIWKEFPTGSGNWSLLTTTTNTNFNDLLTIIDCFDLISYRVEIADASGCVSVSSIDGDQFPDSSVPTAPDFRCVEVNTDGSITLTWLPPTDTVLAFGGYYVYKSNNAGGPFIVVDSVTNYAQLNYTDVTSNGNIASVFYRLETKSGCGAIWSPPSVTLQSIYLDVTNITGNASLSWNSIANPALPTTSPDYEIYRQYPNSAWTLLSTTTNTNYLDVILDVCSDTIKYRIEQSDASGCVSVSNVDGDLIQSLLVPDPPSVRCISIEPNGDVTLSWVPPIDTVLQFNSYHLYYSSAPGGPFVKIDSIFTYANATYTHIGANAINTNAYYYMETRSGCGVRYSPPSDTLRAIRLNVANAGNGTASLTWNPTHQPVIASSYPFYNIYKEYPIGSWNFLTSTSNTFYVDSITVCEEFINYRIEIEDSSGCVSISSVDGDLFKDVIPPVLTILDTVSVDPLTGLTTVSWIQNNSGDAIGYNVYLYNGVSWDSIGTTAPNTTLSFLNGNSNAALGSELYSIAAFDSCGNLSPIGVGHNTIYTTANLDKCLGAIIINWNDYVNMAGGVGSYEIYVSENGGPFSLLGAVSGNTTVFAHDSLTRLSNYCYFIKAISTDNSRSASSNQACEIADILVEPQWNYIKQATVVSASLIHVEAYVDTAADISYYKLLRSLSPTGPWDTVAWNSTINMPVITFDDITAFPNETSYFYVVAAVNICDKIVSYSNLTRTIFTTAQANDNYTNTVRWNDYAGFDAGVESYNIYRFVPPGPWSFLTNVPFGVTEHEDNIINIINTDGTFLYRIQAIEEIGNQYGFKETAFSNETPAIQDPVIFIPNAFTPGGFNPLFKPSAIYVDASTYVFSIYNRWGELIFQTKELNDGWTGDYQGNPAPQGVYVYMLKVKGANGREIIKKGPVTLLR